MTLAASLPEDIGLPQELQSDLRKVLAQEQVLLPEERAEHHAAPAANALKDPALAVCQDHDFQKSALEAVACCKEASQGHEAAFEESGDESRDINYRKVHICEGQA